MLKVLLVAPTDPKIPSDLRLLVGGENTFTKSLLASPPKNVKYTYFHEALAKGEIEYTLLHIILSILTKLRILPIGAGSQCLRIKADFDLVHSHVYGIKIDRDIPIILSDSSSNYLFLRDYVNWPKWRISFGYFLKRWLFKILGVIDADVSLGKAKKLIVFSNFAFKIHKKLGAPESKMVVINPGQPAPNLSFPRKQESRTGLSIRSRMTDKRLVNILFVGIWFERKGGPLLIEAFKRLSGRHKNIKLTIIGDVPKKYKFSYSSSEGAKATESRGKIESSRLRSNNIEQLDFVPREKLMREFFPKADIFVLVPPKVEGFGFAVLEAMSFGIPVIVSQVCALPELVRDGETGFIVKAGSVRELAKRLENLIVDKHLRKRMAQASRARFLKEYSAGVMNNKLVGAYKSAVDNI